MQSITWGLSWHTSLISFLRDPTPREWLMLCLILSRMGRVRLSDMLQVSLTVVMEDLGTLHVLLMLPVTFSFTRMVEMKMKTPELVLRMTKRYCWGLCAEVTGKKPRRNPSPSKNDNIRVFLKAARIFADCPTCLKKTLSQCLRHNSIFPTWSQPTDKQLRLPWLWLQCWKQQPSQHLPRESTHILHLANRQGLGHPHRTSRMSPCQNTLT